MEELGLHKGGEGNEVDEAVRFGAYEPSGHLGCNARGTLFSVTMTLLRDRIE